MLPTQFSLRVHALKSILRAMDIYLGLLRDVLEHGEERSDRTGTGTLSVFGRQARYDLRQGFPCLTTKSSTCAPSSTNSSGS